MRGFSAASLKPSVVRSTYYFPPFGVAQRSQWLTSFLTLRDVSKNHHRSVNQVDFIDSLIQHAPAHMSAFDLAVKVLAIEFATIDFPSYFVIQALFEISRMSPEVLTSIREEIEQVLEQEQCWDKKGLSRLTKLDSLLREIGRVHRPTLLVMQRLTAADFKLHNGVILPAGYKVALDSQALHFDPQVYPTPTVFDPLRFSKLSEQANDDHSMIPKFDLTKVSRNYLPFGTGRHACPGRFFASIPIKIMLSHILLNYDIQLPDGHTSRPENLVFDGVVETGSTVSIFAHRYKVTDSEQSLYPQDDPTASGATRTSSYIDYTPAPLHYSYDVPPGIITGSYYDATVGVASLHRSFQEATSDQYSQLGNVHRAPNTLFVVQDQGPDTTVLNASTGPDIYKTTHSVTHDEPALYAPSPQVPTPSAMALWLDAGNEPFFSPQEVDAAPNCEAISSPKPNADSGTQARRHDCAMCHNSFDRPSTLRKHLLVHTGAKPFQCDYCHRRFATSSNLKRHASSGACFAKPIGAIPSETSKSSSATATSSTSIHLPTSPVAVPEIDQVVVEPAPPKRKRRRATASSNSQPSTSGPMSQDGSTDKHTAPKPKRSRRAPSPSKWRPPTLLRYDLHSDVMKESVLVPLPPVLPSKVEERNSFQENDENPYHPSGWRNKLPGPGLKFGSRIMDSRNFNVADPGGIMLMRLASY
ncbi:hypothetical protein ONZ45_g18363 [Pleurotus djamor]|nr:hypothetical protein ONZ45_g18363 [Pleurotus djamor]